MNILVVSQYYYPEQFRINDICEELVKRGHSVSVLTGLPNYPEGKIFEGYKDKGDTVTEHNGVTIIRSNVRPRYSGALNLALNYYDFWKKAQKKILTLKNSFDVIYVYQLSPITSVFPAVAFKKKHGVPIFTYCCDIWPDSVRDTAKGKPMSAKNPIYLVAKWLSKKAYNGSDIIGVKCNQFINYLDAVCRIPKDKCKLIYEHAESSYLAVSETPCKNGCFDFMFLGNIGHATNCDYIIKAFQKINSNKPYKLHFVGSGTELENLKKYVENNELGGRVIFHGQHPVTEINQFYDFADCCILTLSSKTTTGLTPPAKLTGYMAASRPILAAANGASKDIIEDADCGICVESEDIDGLAAAMQYALDNEIEFVKKGLNGRKYFFSHFTLDKYIDELEKQLLALIGG